jgi:hypothetical protein
MGELFEAYEKGFGKFIFFSCEDLGRSCGNEVCRFLS